MSTRLSKSALENFNRCPRCFWLEKNHKIKQPEGIRSGLPMGMDRVLKAHYDAHRASGTMPPELVADLPGWKLYDGKAISMADLRNWRKGLSVKVGEYELSTALDDLLFNPMTGLYSMIDYKTKAKATDAEATKLYYQTQADAYDLALNVNKYSTDGQARFAYYYPVAVSGEDKQPHSVPMSWNCQVITISADHERIKDNVIRAGKCLEGPLPEPGKDCTVCNYVPEREQMLKAMASKAATV